MISVVLLDIVCLLAILIISSGSVLEIADGIFDDEPLGAFGVLMVFGVLAGVLYIWFLYINYNVIFSNDLTTLIESMKQEVKHVWQY